jgi:hypothetical protein
LPVITPGRGRKPHVRHETARIYHAARRRGGRVAAIVKLAKDVNLVPTN